MKLTNTNFKTDPKYAREILETSAKRYCESTGTEYKKELKNINVIDFNTYYGNFQAIVAYLHYSRCNLTMHETHPEQGQNLKPEYVEVIATELLNTQILVELLKPKYERSKAQRELEALIDETGGVYLVVRNFEDFCRQCADAVTCNKLKYFDE